MKLLMLTTVVVALLGCHRAEDFETTVNTSLPVPSVTERPTSVVAVEASTMEISEDVVRRYVVVEAEILAMSKAFMMESFALQEQAGRGRRQSAVRAREGSQERRRQLDASIAAIRERSGVPLHTWDILDRLYESLFKGRMVWRQSGGDQAIALLESAVRAQLDQMPRERRAEAERELMKLTTGLKGLRDGAEARSLYGDEVVDYALTHGGELEDLRAELFQLAERQH